MTAMPMSAVHRTAPHQPPVLVEVTRGGMVESRHAGSVAVVDAKGRMVVACGDVAQAIYPRSAIKPIQALPLVESGAADRYKLGDAELALACASHGGEPRHVATVLAWLGRIGCTAEDLECGGHPPSNEAAAEALYRGNGTVTPLHNNCSGKHTGFLSLAKHRGWPTRGYIDEDHPVQQAVLKTLCELSGADLASADLRGARGIDGCGIPVVGMKLESLALAMARFADPSGLPPERQAAIKRVRTAMAREPFMVAGTGRFCTRAMTQLGEAAIVKTGAEGVFMAALPTLGFGVCLKMADGASRAAQVALATVMDRLGLAGAKELIETPLKNVAGRAVGVVRPASDLPF